jgi:hypothetical protein
MRDTVQHKSIFFLSGPYEFGDTGRTPHMDTTGAARAGSSSATSPASAIARTDLDRPFGRSDAGIGKGGSQLCLAAF